MPDQAVPYELNAHQIHYNTRDLVFAAIRPFLAARLEHETIIIEGLHFFHQIVCDPAGFDRLFEQLGDNESRDVLAWVIQYRVAAYFLQSKHAAGEMFPPQISSYEWDQLTHRASQHEAARLHDNLDSDVVENWLLDGYMLPGHCEVSSHDIVFDCGAFNGNSSIVFSRKAKDGKVFSFEPNPLTAEGLARNITAMGGENIEVVAAALSDRPGTVRFNRDGAASRLTPEGDIEVEATTLDAFVEKRGIDRVDFLKFDIEGFEFSAINGARGLIRRFRPKMAISVYHLHHDLLTIPSLVREICPWYRMFLRHNAVIDGEVVLYCEPIHRAVSSMSQADGPTVAQLQERLLAAESQLLVAREQAKTDVEHVIRQFQTSRSWRATALLRRLRI